MKPPSPRSSLFSNPGGELSLSGPAFGELLRSVLSSGVPFRFQAKGSSMTPFIKNGDFITISPLFDIPPRVGDVVAFNYERAGNPVVHRVVGKRGKAFLITGDNASHTHDLVPETDILGRVTQIERDGKKVYLGLGPERVLIASPACRRLLLNFLLPLWRLVRKLMRAELRREKVILKE